jgi:predicted transcriptional regulator
MAARTDTFSVRLPEDVKHQVEELARLTNRSSSFIIEEAISTYMRDHADYIRELDDAVKSAESGVGHSSEQIFNWMRSWGTNEERPSPSPDIGLSKRPE